MARGCIVDAYILVAEVEVEILIVLLSLIVVMVLYSLLLHWLRASFLNILCYRRHHL